MTDVDRERSEGLKKPGQPWSSAWSATIFFRRGFSFPLSLRAIGVRLHSRNQGYWSTAKPAPQRRFPALRDNMSWGPGGIADARTPGLIGRGFRSAALHCAVLTDQPTNHSVR